MNKYLPEQFYPDAPIYKVEDIRNAIKSGDILEGLAVKCGSDLGLEVKLSNKVTGIIPVEEFEYSLNDKATKSVAVISKVGKRVKFIVKDLRKVNGKYVADLSRKDAQKKCYDEYISKFNIGEIIDAKVTYIEHYGLFCDIGCGITALLPVENICTTRLNDPKVALKRIRRIKAVIKNIENDKITLTHKELLGTWEEEVSNINVSDTVVGIVRVVESYGIFVELTPNLVGLAEPYPDLKCGDYVTVYVKNIVPEKMKVKLLILAKNDIIEDGYMQFNYKIPESNNVRDWVYSPESSTKKIESHF